jgi:4-hydroxybenzoate polyprenyltransferase
MAILHYENDTTSARKRRWPLLRLLRPRQVTKNMFCFAGALFGPGRLLDREAWQIDLATFAIFCFVSSAVYIFNDVVDRERDRRHPRKQHRPIASGEVGVAAALSMAVFLSLVSLISAFAINEPLFACAVLYLINNIAYTLKLKHLALFDVLCIAGGFIFRLLAGIYALGDLPTAWITLCTFFLSLFLGFCKRRSELSRLDPLAVDQEQRPVLSKYTVQLLDYLVNSSATMTILCYALFTTSTTKNPTLVVTVPIVVFAVMHYERLAMLWGVGEEPEQVVVRDARLLLAGLVWMASYLAITMSDIHLFR